MMKKAFTPRAVFAVVTIITIGLLVGSIILQNIYFRAEGSDSSVYLSPTSFSIKPGDTIDMDIKAAFDGATQTAGGQFVIEFDQSKLEFREILPSDGWQTLKEQTAPSRLAWAFVPASSQGASLLVKEEIKFATLKFIGRGVGQVQVKVNQAESAVVSIDPSKSPSQINVISSIQNAIGAVSTASSAVNKVVPDALSVPGEVLSVFKGQSLIRNEVVVGSDSARALLSLGYQGTVSVQFGITPEMNSSVETVEPSVNHSVRISGLVPDTRYYYRVSIYSADRKSIIRSQLRSFTTASVGSGLPSVDRTILAVLPERAKSTASVVASVRDQNSGSLIGDYEIRITSGLGQILRQSAQGSLIVADVAPATSAMTKVSVGIFSSDQLLEEAEVTFDPSIIESTEQPAQFKQMPEPNTGNLLLIFGSAAGFILFGLIFIHLSRNR